MSRFTPILEELRHLQKRLKITADRLWSIKLAKAAVSDDSEFVSRRMEIRELEEQKVFKNLLTRLHSVMSQSLDSSVMALSSIDDVETVAKISRTMRFLHKSALPAFSNN